MSKKYRWVTSIATLALMHELILHSLAEAGTLSDLFSLGAHTPARSIAAAVVFLVLRLGLFFVVPCVLTFKLLGALDRLSPAKPPAASRSPWGARG